MEQYINKTALVAEIERLKDEYLRHSRNKFYAGWSCGTLDDILRFIETLEVKEVDLDLGSPECDVGIKTIWYGDKIVSSKAQKENNPKKGL